MKRHVLNALAVSSVLAVSATAAAQDATQADAARPYTETTVPAKAPAADASATAPVAEDAAAGASDQTADIGIAEVIVTARRKSESLQDVPQTVNAVSNDTLQKLNIQKFEDVQSIVPGLTMSAGTTGYTTAATIRGASFQVESDRSEEHTTALQSLMRHSSAVFCL